jgi:hypothetical protein
MVTTTAMATAFQMGQRVICKDNGDASWLHGVVTSVDPLLVKVDGDDSSYGFDLVQPDLLMTTTTITAVAMPVSSTGRAAAPTATLSPAAPSPAARSDDDGVNAQAPSTRGVVSEWPPSDAPDHLIFFNAGWRSTAAGKDVVAAETALEPPAAIYDASVGATSRRWADSSMNANDLRWHGNDAPTFVNRFGVGSHYSFTNRTRLGFWQSVKKTGMSGRDTAVSVCAVYRDTSGHRHAAAVLTSWSGGAQKGHEMKWISQRGHPGTDDGVGIGRLSKMSTSRAAPSHVCWTTSRWESQSLEQVTRIFINGAQVRTQHSPANQEKLDQAFEGMWQIGSGSNGANFEGDIWSIKIWQHCLSPADVKDQYLMVGKPIQNYEASLEVFLQLPDKRPLDQSPLS